MLTNLSKNNTKQNNEDLKINLNSKKIIIIITV